MEQDLELDSFYDCPEPESYHDLESESMATREHAIWIETSNKKKEDPLVLMKRGTDRIKRSKSNGDLNFVSQFKMTEQENVHQPHIFTIAPPYLNLGDFGTVYKDLSQKERFKSPDQLMKSKSESQKQKWDGEALVSDKVLLRQQVKDVRLASQQLINAGKSEIPSLRPDLAQQNPMFKQPTYGVIGNEGDNAYKKRSSVNLARDDVGLSYIRPAVIPPEVNQSELLYGKEAYQYYLSHKRELDKMELEKAQPIINALRKRLINKRDAIEKVMQDAREYYTKPYTPRKSIKESLKRTKDYLFDPEYTGKKLLQRGESQTDIRLQLESTVIYMPWLIYMIMLLQAVAVGVLCATNGVVSPRLTPQTHVVDDVMTWGGLASIENSVLPNMWLGPSIVKLLSSGALYAACLREDKLMLLRRAIYKAHEMELGCCEAEGRGAGTTTERECAELIRLFKIKDSDWYNTTCSQRNRAGNTDAKGLFVPHDFKPCCIPGSGTCLLINHKHCVVLGGIWHLSGYDHCSQANCDHDICQVYIHSDHMTYTESWTQFWRLPLSLFYHQGIIHAALFILAQWYLAVEVEEVTGWLKFGLIYLICGCGGLLYGITFVPYFPTSGSGGVVSGILAIHIVEYTLNYSLVQKRLVEGVKLFALTFAVLFLGLLPGINQFTHIFGMILGLPCYFIFIPYVRFTRRQESIMCICQIISYTVLAVLFATAFCLFYITQPFDIGNWGYLNCLAFLEGSCKNSLL